MANKKITQLTEFTTPANNDVMPIVDVTLSETKKIRWSSIKTALAAIFITGVGVRTITVATTAPLNPAVGDLWVDTS